jgi:prepilin-type N-terminal cleavage/methylation domain-containing protein
LLLRRKGFSLIEMLVAIVVIGVLTAIALPVYSKYVARSRQADAKVQLVAIRQAQEIYKFQYGTYTSATGSLSGWKGTAGRYTFAITAAGANSFSARAAGNIDGDATNDEWTMDQDGNLFNATNDVEN